LKRELWGSALVQEKYQEEKACDKRQPYRILLLLLLLIIIIIITIVISGVPVTTAWRVLRLQMEDAMEGRCEYIE